MGVPTDMKKEPYSVVAVDTTETKEEVGKVAVNSNKGIPFTSPDGSEWVLQIDDAGTPVVTKITK